MCKVMEELMEESREQGQDSMLLVFQMVKENEPEEKILQVTGVSAERLAQVKALQSK